MKKILINLPIACCLCLLMSCSKNAFLDEKPNSSIIIPSTLPELRGMLDYTQVFTFSPGLGEMATDDYYMLPVNWQALSSIVERNSYTWEADLYSNQLSVPDWSMPYQQILYANIVLEQLEKIQPATSEIREWEDIKGTALFKRAWALSNLVQHFAAAFDSATMNTTPGVPIRLTTDVKNYLPRNSIKECYDQVFNDLTQAAKLLLPVVPATAKNRPSKPAVYALAARNALLTGQYEKAKNYADSALQLYNHLTDYNTVSATAVTPFDISQPEVLYYCQAISRYTILQTTSTTVFVDTSLYRSYNSNDLRRSIFFRTSSGTNMGFKRGYSGNTLSFTGLATDEVYLIRAESLARLGQTNSALTDLNSLLQKRWRSGTFIPVTAVNATDALTKIIAERRKELVWRGLRWHDLKRLNKKGAAIQLKRILGTDNYLLEPTSNKYVFPIPQEEISLSALFQNPR